MAPKPEPNQPPAPPVHGGGPEAHHHASNQPLKMMLAAVPWYGLLYVLVLLCALRGCVSLRRHLRHKSTTSPANLADAQQAAWRTSLPVVPFLKKWVIYAPLWVKRRSQRARWLGTLPTRLQAIVLAFFFLTNIGFLLDLDWEHSQRRPVRVQLMGRSGAAMTANVIPLILMAARNNPLERMLQISHDTHILLHRWIGRMMCLHLVVHVASWTVGRVGDGGWSTVGDKLVHSSFIGAGFIGFVSAVFLFALSFNSVRRWSYETFLNVHIFLALGFLISGALHCYNHPPPLPQLWLIVGALSLWVMERLYRLISQVYCSWTFSSGASTAVVEALPDETKACLITMELRRYLKIRQGAHAYIRLEAVEPWASHPFSIAWVDNSAAGHDSLGSAEKRAEDDNQDNQDTVTTVSFIVGAQEGFTRTLYDQARSSPQSLFKTRGTFEGPYGGHHSLSSYGHVVLFAGATGICHQLRHVRFLVDGHRAAKVSARRVVLVWVIRDIKTLAWIRSWLRTMGGSPEFLQIKIFVTRPEDVPLGLAVGLDLPLGVSVEAGRPSIATMLQQEVEQQIGAMCVTVCGPGGLADDVRAAVRAAQDTRQEIDFLEESFSW